MRNTQNLHRTHTRQSPLFPVDCDFFPLSHSASGAWSDVSDVCAIITSALCASAAAIKRKSRCFSTLVHPRLSRIRFHRKNSYTYKIIFSAFGGCKKSESEAHMHVRMGFSHRAALKGAAFKLTYMRFCCFSLSFSILHTRSATLESEARRKISRILPPLALLTMGDSQFEDQGMPSIVPPAFVNTYTTIILLGEFHGLLFWNHQSMNRGESHSSTKQMR